MIELCRSKALLPWMSGMGEIQINKIIQDCEGKNFVFRIFTSRFYQNNRSVGGICGYRL